MNELKHCSNNLNNSVLSSINSSINHCSFTDSSISSLTNSSINHQLQQLHQHKKHLISQTQPASLTNLQSLIYVSESNQFHLVSLLSISQVNLLLITLHYNRSLS